MNGDLLHALMGALGPPTKEEHLTELLDTMLSLYAIPVNLDQLESARDPILEMKSHVERMRDALAAEWDAIYKEIGVDDSGGVLNVYVEARLLRTWCHDLLKVLDESIADCNTDRVVP